MKTKSTFLVSLFLFNVITIVLAEPVKVTNTDLNITILYDNYIFKEGLKTDWGFACLIEGLDKTILFDTGTHGNILLDNAKKLGVDLKDVDVLAISHDHRDHYGGMDDFLKQNNQVDVYLLEAFSKQRTQTVQRYGANVVSVQEPLQICKGAWLTGELGTQIKEQTLVLDTTKGLVVITGCAHPGIVSIVKKAREIIPKNVHMVFGGFHMLHKSEDDIQDTIKTFRKLGVKYAGPSHCSGDRTITMFRRAYGENFIKLGAGKRITLAWPDANKWMYLGQKPPKDIPVKFAPEMIATKARELACSFSPDGKQLVFTRSDKNAKIQQTLFTSKLINNQWTKPKELRFTGKYPEMEAFFSPNGKKLFFTSRYPLNDSGKPNNLWFVEITETGFGKAQKLPDTVNTEEYDEYYGSVSMNENIYFQRHGDIFYSEYINGTYIEAKPLKEINSQYHESHPFIAPDESFLIFDSARPGGYDEPGGYIKGDLYISFHKDNRSWSEPVNLGPKINSGKIDKFPALSPDGKYIFFSRIGSDKDADIYWVSAAIIQELKAKLK